MDKKEGAFCVWTEQEVRSLLSQPVEGLESVTLADIFCHHYSVKHDGNVNPHQVGFGKFVLLMRPTTHIHTHKHACAHTHTHMHFCTSPSRDIFLQDPHDELKNQNVLIVRGSLDKTAAKFKTTAAAVSSQLEKARHLLFEVRKKRPPPHLDNKMLTAWNGNVWSLLW